MWANRHSAPIQRKRNNPLISKIYLAETVGFEFYFRHHLRGQSNDFGEISASTRPGNHIETCSELFTCGQTVGKRHRCPETSDTRADYGLTYCLTDAKDEPESGVDVDAPAFLSMTMKDGLHSVTGNLGWPQA
jgi:hypothetical protein